MDSLLELFELSVTSSAYVEPDSIAFGPDDEAALFLREKIQIRSNVVSCVQKKGSRSFRMSNNAFYHAFPYQVLRILSQVLTLKDDGNPPYGRPMKQVPVHDGSG